MNMTPIVYIFFISSYAIKVNDNHNNMELFLKEQKKKIILPGRLISSPAYELIIKPDTKTKKEVVVVNGGPRSGGGGSGGDGSSGGDGGVNNGTNLSSQNHDKKEFKIKKSFNVSELLKSANKLFYRKKFKSAMELLDEAEKIEPDNARLHAMKGSIFYTNGSLKNALKHWNKSLEINQDQPDLKKFLKLTEEKIP